MENDTAVAAYEPAAPLVGEPVAPQQQPGFLPRLRGPRFNVALLMAGWGVAGVLRTTVPNLNANRDHVMLYFLCLMAGVLLLLLSVATPDLDWADTAAAYLEEWIRRAVLF